MKKYKVLTDNLDWYDAPKDSMITFLTDKVNVYNPELDINVAVSGQIFDSLLYCVKLHPDWFEEIQEKEFTKDDMMNFANYFRCRLAEKVIPRDDFEELALYLGKWIRKVKS